MKQIEEKYKLVRQILCPTNTKNSKTLLGEANKVCFFGVKDIVFSMLLSQVKNNKW